MIKINLGSKKTASFLSSDGRTTLGASLPRLRMDLQALKEIPVMRLVLALGLPIALYWGVNDLKEAELQKLENQLQKLTTEQTRLQAEVNRTRGFEAIKAQLEADEFTIKTKIQAIRGLAENRDETKKLLLVLAEIVPEEVWLTHFKVQDGNTSFEGKSLGFGQVSDFMNKLNESSYFKDLALKVSEQVRDTAVEGDVARFELEAKRRFFSEVKTP